VGGCALTQRQLNRAVLARQGLLDPFDDSLPRVLERVAGIQAQYAPSMYVGLWSRMRGLERSLLTHALEKRSVVQGTLLRSTIHLVSREDYWPFAVATRDKLREWFLRVSKGDPSATELDAAAKRVRSALAVGPLRQTEIDALVGRSARAGINTVLDLVRIPPSGTWERRRADLHADAESWIGPPDISASDARALLVRRYLGGFGPATTAEIGNGPACRRRSGSSPPGTPSCWSTPAVPGSSRRSIARRSSAAAIPTRCRPSSSTVPSPARGGTSTGGSI